MKYGAKNDDELTGCDEAGREEKYWDGKQGGLYPGSGVDRGRIAESSAVSFCLKR